MILGLLNKGHPKKKWNSSKQINAKTLIIIIIINLLLLSATSDPRQITGNMSVAEMPLALYNSLLRNT